MDNADSTKIAFSTRRQDVLHDYPILDIDGDEVFVRL